MQKFTLKDIAIPIIKAIDKFNFLLKSHHRRVAILSYYIGKEYGLSGDSLAQLVVAAAMHDIGALSISERDMLIQEDIQDPSAHCLMAYRILKDCEIFSNIGIILKHHHIRYDNIYKYENELKFESHILHFADRIDIYLSPDSDPLSQVEEITEKFRRRTGRVFHPEVFEVFKRLSLSPEFWRNLESLSMEDILKKIDFQWGLEMNQTQLTKFAIVISKIVDYRSHYTATHSYTVGYLAYHLGKMLKYPEEKCVKLLISGLLHDIGKIGIDPDIIKKKGKLDADEYDQIKLHSVYTGEILEDLSKNGWFSDIVRWSKHHHERIDGKGYPSHLDKSNMDQGMIIIAFSDIISALMEERPYRGAMNYKEMMSVLKNGEAKRLDEKLFKKITKNIKGIVDCVSSSQYKASRIYIEPLENLLSL